MSTTRKFVNNYDFYLLVEVTLLPQTLRGCSEAKFRGGSSEANKFRGCYLLLKKVLFFSLKMKINLGKLNLYNILIQMNAHVY